MPWPLTIMLLAAAIFLLPSCASPSAEQPARPSPGPQRPSGSGAGSEYDGVVVGRATASATDLAATLAIDPARSIGTASPLLFGTNQAWLPQERMMAGGPDGGPLPEFSALAAGLPMPLNRMAGSDSAHFRWKAAVGPMRDRTPISDEFRSSRVRALGPLEWVRTVRGIDPSARFTWTFNCLQEEPADHADLAAFLTGTPGGRRDGGEDWAARRAAWGMPQPVEVAIWEIGNEVDHGTTHGGRFPDAAAYAGYAARTIAAVRAVQPQASFAVHAATAPWSWGQRHAGDWRDWHRTVLQRVGRDIDWLVFHPYYCGLPISEIERHLDILRDDCATLVPGHPIRIYVSEHARWPAQQQGRRWEENWFHTHSLGGCLATAQFLVRMLNRPEVGAAAYHALSAGPWGLFYDRDFVRGVPVPLWRTAMADLLTAFRPLHGGAVVASALDGERTAGAEATCAAAVVRDGGDLLLALVNREPTAARRIAIAVPGRWRIAGGTTLTAPELDAVDTPDARPIVVAAIPAAPERVQAWTLPPRHFAILRLEPAP